MTDIVTNRPLGQQEKTPTSDLMRARDRLTAAALALDGLIGRIESFCEWRDSRRRPLDEASYRELLTDLKESLNAAAAAIVAPEVVEPRNWLEQPD